MFLVATTIALNAPGAAEHAQFAVGLDDPTTAEGDHALFNVGFQEAPHLAPGDLFHGARVLSVIEEISFVTVTTDDEAGFLAAAEADPDVLVVEPDAHDAVRALKFTPNDPFFSIQWGLGGTYGIDAPGAWATTLGSSSVTVAVLDSGVELVHEDMGTIVGSADCMNTFICIPGPVVDTCGHGTHVAGTVAARTNNGMGVAGVAQVSILDVKVIGLDPGGVIGCVGQWGSLARGIVWATGQGADVITMSLGGGGSSSAVNAALQHATGQDVLLIASAGNLGCSSGNTVLYPANSPLVMAVANHRIDGTMAPNSSCGPQIEISAPGTEIRSTCQGVTFYCVKSGTSMAAPHVAGTAALLLSDSPSMTPDQVRDQMKNTAVDLGYPSHRQGAGGLNACQALGGGNQCT